MRPQVLYVFRGGLWGELVALHWSFLVYEKYSMFEAEDPPFSICQWGSIQWPPSDLRLRGKELNHWAIQMTICDVS